MFEEYLVWSDAAAEQAYHRLARVAAGTLYDDEAARAIGVLLTAPCTAPNEPTDFNRELQSDGQIAERLEIRAGPHKKDWQVLKEVAAYVGNETNAHAAHHHRYHHHSSNWSYHEELKRFRSLAG